MTAKTAANFQTWIRLSAPTRSWSLKALTSRQTRGYCTSDPGDQVKPSGHQERLCRPDPDHQGPRHRRAEREPSTAGTSRAASHGSARAAAFASVRVGMLFPARYERT